MASGCFLWFQWKGWGFCGCVDRSGVSGCCQSQPATFTHTLGTYAPRLSSREGGDVTLLWRTGGDFIFHSYERAVGLPGFFGKGEDEKPQRVSQSLLLLLLLCANSTGSIIALFCLCLHYKRQIKHRQLEPSEGPWVCCAVISRPAHATCMHCIPIFVYSFTLPVNSLATFSCYFF